MKLIPLVIRPDGKGLAASKLEPIQEVSQEKFIEEYAENPLAVTVDGKSGITAYSGKQPMAGWFLVE